ncbi:hypothetical protein [Bartonella sp. DGB2]|uniref:hypothetical protein n=1 Tax=Bartonella sp. DGB2 TaxID=3388426 RepID=UPI00398FB70B
MVPVAYVTLTPAGIASIEAVQENRIISLEKVQTDITNVKGWMHNTGKRIDTLDTDMTALASSLKGVVRQDEFFNAAADIGRLKARVGMHA